MSKSRDYTLIDREMGTDEQWTSRWSDVLVLTVKRSRKMASQSQVGPSCTRRRRLVTARAVLNCVRTQTTVPSLPKGVKGLGERNGKNVTYKSRVGSEYAPRKDFPRTVRSSSSSPASTRATFRFGEMDRPHCTDESEPPSASVYFRLSHRRREETVSVIHIPR